MSEFDKSSQNNINKDDKWKIDSGRTLEDLFKIVLETRNFEITQLVQRNNFFMIFQGVLLAGMIQSTHNNIYVSACICVAGFVVSWLQVQMACGAKFWQEYWESKLDEIEVHLIEYLSVKKERSKLFRLFGNDRSDLNEAVGKRLQSSTSSDLRDLIMCKFSVSRVPIYVALLFLIVWFFLLTRIFVS